MKLIVLSLLLMSCAQKFQTYHVIDKHNFNINNPVPPVIKKMAPGKKTEIDFCAGQIFFMSNAKKDTDRHLSNLTRTMCPDSNYLLNSTLTETWWTTIIYSRSCVRLESYCPRVKN